MGALEDAVEALYAADLDSFTATRTELAKAAKSAGDREGAAAITALRKPTVAAFTVNRLARTDPDAVEQLIDLGKRLQQAQRTTDAGAMRELNKERRQLLSELVTRAFDVVGQQSPSAAAQEDVSATFQAALADSSVAEALRSGTLVKAAESAGFGFTAPELTLLPGGASARSGAAAPKRPKDGEGGGTKVAAAGRRAGRADAAPEGQDKAEQDRTDEKADVDNAKDKARKEQADKAQRQEEKRRAEKERAQAEVTAADSAVDEAIAAIEAGQQRIRRLQHELLDARSDLEAAQQAARTAEARQKKARTALNRL
jgi:hypothetical protein